MHSLRDEEESFEVPLTPLIDIVFLLLIFFLVATSFTQKEIDQKVRIPQTEGGEVQTLKRESLVINIRRKGAIVVNGRLIKTEKLRSTISEWHKKNRKGNVAIRGDKDVAYGYIARVFGMCKAIGVSDVDLPVEELEGNKVNQ